MNLLYKQLQKNKIFKGINVLPLVCVPLTLHATNDNSCGLGTIPGPDTGKICILDPDGHPKFVNSLPHPIRIDAVNRRQFTVDMAETTQWLGLVDRSGDKLITKVWGYGVSPGPVTFPGPTFIANKDVGIRINWRNKLPLTQHFLPVDTSLHIAQPFEGSYEQGRIPTVVHLHGGHTEAESDGYPDAWFTQDFWERGIFLQKKSYHYQNDQESATLWYHDHALGLTRLNVYAGLAGFYLLRDDNESRLINQNRIPSGAYEVELAIQDRMFTPDGQLFYHSDPPVPEAPEPSHLPENFGNFILVNGMAWPKLDVEPRQYRLRLLNGSDSRTYHLAFADVDDNNKVRGHLPFHQIGTDGGFLSQPIKLNDLILMPGERADIVVDFADYCDKRIIVTNDAPEPFPGGNPTQAGADQVMAFVVGRNNGNEDPIELPKTLRAQDYHVTGTVATTRQLLLGEGTDKYGRIRSLLGPVADGQLHWDDEITETPWRNDVEIWEFYNRSPDTHSIHLHQVSFEVLDRQAFTATEFISGALSEINLGKRYAVPDNEKGPKDTVQVHPGQVTRIRVKFDLPGDYVWHCHILSHEDNEMMRPLKVR